MAKIFIGGFSKKTNEMQLVELVSRHGEVVTIKIVRDERSGKSKGYAFLHMKDQASAEKTIQALDGAELGDHVLSVNIAEEKKVAPKKPGPPSYRTNTSKPAYFKGEKPAFAEKKKRPRKQF